MKQQIKIDFTDFWPGFNKQDNYFFHLLNQGMNWLSLKSQIC